MKKARFLQIPNARLIQLVNDARRFREMVELSDNMSEEEKRKLIDRIQIRIQESKRNRFTDKMEDYLLGSRLPDSFSGYTKPDFTKFSEMVKFFSEKINPWKTVLNKLLFYSDFLSYRETCYSMSGVRYRAIKRGPVPNNYGSIYEFMFNNGSIEILNVAFTAEIYGDKFNIANGQEFNREMFSEQELEILNRVCSTFSAMDTKQIIEFSHNERAWTENEEERKLIDYNYAFDIIQL